MSETLTQQEIVRAVTNSPALSTTEVKLGDKVVKIVDLSYDDYCLFMAHLQPLLELLVGKLGSAVGFEKTEAAAFGVKELLKYCGNVIPDLALLCVKQTDPEMEMDELKLLAKSPFKLANLVIKQIEHNRIIEEIGDFFVQILPFLPRKVRQG